MQDLIAKREGFVNKKELFKSEASRFYPIIGEFGLDKSSEDVAIVINKK